MKTVYPQIVTSADMLKSTIQLEQLMEKLKKNNARAAAITNSRLYGLLPFWHAAKKHQIHPVFGLSLKVELVGEASVVLYARTDVGYKNLLKISSSMETREATLLPRKWLEAYKEGLSIVYKGDVQFTKENLLALKELFEGYLYVGIVRPNGNRLKEEQEIVETASQAFVPITVYHESRYIDQSDAFAYEVLNAMDQSVKMSDPHRIKPALDAHVPSEAEWNNWFAGNEDWLANTEAMLESCQVDMGKTIRIMPKFPLPDGITAGDYLRKLCEDGLHQRLSPIPSKYSQRLTYELDVIKTMNYEDYFLIVQDFMKFAKNAGILTGPGRGSSASSLVAYSLGITNVDPLKYGLLFERFLNPERISLPDIDIDFADSRRMEVVHYVAEKYGKNYVSQIITFGTLSAKSAAREVARVFGFENTTLEAISSFIPNKLGITLKEAYQSSPKLREFIETEEIRKKWFQVALAIEGLPRNASTHAAGIVMSPIPIVEIVPIQKGQEEIYLTQWPMREVEEKGLLKMDFLGLRNLTIIERILKTINYHCAVKFTLEDIPLNDEKTFEMLRQGDTTGVFQLESEGMRNALRQINPTKFEDIVAVNALFRPGPMESIPLYAARKSGKAAITYEHPVLEPILKETYGIIVYQEQIMQIASQMAGFTFGEADILRRAVSKKNREILEKERKHFMQKAMEMGHTSEAAGSVYDLIVRFADYGFPKSHAVAYSIISYQLAYLKANYPIHFYGALLTSSMGNQEKINQLVMEMKHKKIPVLPPSIFKSYASFTIDDNAVRFGLQAVKGVSYPFTQKLLQKRSENKKWGDIFDLAADLSAVHFSRKNIEPLVKAGALDEFGEERSTLLATIDAAVKYAELINPKDEVDLFEGDANPFGKSKYVRREPMPLLDQLQFEKEVLGQYFSEHPTALLKKNAPNIQDIWDLQRVSGSIFGKILGIILDIKKIRTKKGEAMAFVTIQDDTGTLSITLFPEEYTKYSTLLKERKIIYVEGKCERRFGKVQMVAKVLKEIKNP